MTCFFRSIFGDDSANVRLLDDILDPGHVDAKSPNSPPALVKPQRITVLSAVDVQQRLMSTCLFITLFDVEHPELPHLVVQASPRCRLSTASPAIT